MHVNKSEIEEDASKSVIPTGNPMFEIKIVCFFIHSTIQIPTRFEYFENV